MRWWGDEVKINMELPTFLNASQEEVQTSLWGMLEYQNLIMSAFNKAHVYRHTSTHAGHVHTHDQLMHV